MKADYNLNFGTQLAIATGNTLLPYCEKLNIAGSVKRRKAVIHDIELVVLPKLQTQAKGLFETQTAPCPQFVMTALSLGKVLKGKPDGRYMQIELPEGINLDLFCRSRMIFSEFWR